MIMFLVSLKDWTFHNNFETIRCEWENLENTTRFQMSTYHISLKILQWHSPQRPVWCQDGLIQRNPMHTQFRFFKHLLTTFCPPSGQKALDQILKLKINHKLAFHLKWPTSCRFYNMMPRDCFEGPETVNVCTKFSMGTLVTEAAIKWCQRAICHAHIWIFVPHIYATSKELRFIKFGLCKKPSTGRKITIITFPKTIRPSAVSQCLRLN